MSNAVVVNGNFSLGGGATDNLTLTGDIATGPYTILTIGAGTNTLSGKISGTGGISQDGGTLILTGANTYTGGTYLQRRHPGGRQQLSAFGTGPLTLIGGTLAASGAARTLANHGQRLRQFQPWEPEWRPPTKTSRSAAP